MDNQFNFDTLAIFLLILLGTCAGISGLGWWMTYQIPDPTPTLEWVYRPILSFATGVFLYIFYVVGSDLLRDKMENVGNNVRWFVGRFFYDLVEISTGRKLALAGAMAFMTALSVMWGSSWWELLSAVSGAVCVFLVADRKISNFVWGLLNCSLYGLTSYYNGFYGDMTLNWGLYVPFQFIGLWLWFRHTSNDEGVATRKLPFHHLFKLALITVLAILCGKAILELVNGNHPLFDSANVVLSVVATALMAGRYTEQWGCWILVNLTGIAMWSLNLYQGNGEGIAALSMWLVFLANSIYGYWSWYRNAR